MRRGLKPDSVCFLIGLLSCCDSLTQKRLKGIQKNLMQIKRCFKHVWLEFLKCTENSKETIVPSIRKMNQTPPNR